MGNAYLDSDPFLFSSQDPFIAPRRPFLPTLDAFPLVWEPKNGVSAFSRSGAWNIRLSLGLGRARDDQYVNSRAMLCCRELDWPTAQMEEAFAGCTNCCCKTTIRTSQDDSPTQVQAHSLRWWTGPKIKELADPTKRRRRCLE